MRTCALCIVLLSPFLCQRTLEFVFLSSAIYSFKFLIPTTMSFLYVMFLCFSLGFFKLLFVYSVLFNDAGIATSRNCMFYT